MNIQKIKKIIIVVLMCIAFVIIAIIVTEKEEKEEKEVNNQIEDNINEKELQGDDDESKIVSDASKFYTVRNCVNSYFDAINIKNYNYYGYNEKKEYTQIVDTIIIKQNIYNLLDRNFVINNDIDLDNINKKIEVVSQKVVFVPLKMNYKESEDIESYVVYGIIEDIAENYLKDLNLIVNLDKVNTTFSVEPLSNVTKNIDEIEVNISNLSIEQNDNNKFDWVSVDDEYIIREYLNSYKRIAIGKPELAYDYLDSEYKEKRFSSVDEYKEYVQKNKEIIRVINASKYLVEESKGYKEYVCMDQYENYYIFSTTSPMNYTLRLDTYTIPSEKFKNAYDSGNEQKKVQLNIDKFIKMINNKDYKNIYNLLDEGFRNNYFKTEDKFEEFVKSKFYEYNEVTFDKFSSEGKIYIYEITLTEKFGQNSSNKKKLNIIMELLDNYQFVMSFGNT